LKSHIFTDALSDEKIMYYWRAKLVWVKGNSHGLL
jgi:phosphoribosyl-AMP cyclohydrolase